MKKSLFFLTMQLLVILLSGCSNLAKYDQQIIDKNQELSDKVQDEYGDNINAAKDKAVEVSKETAKKIADKALQLIISKLTDISKQRIDDWITAQGLNQYGDPKDRMYAGGSPLFDEATSQVKDRYEYILENNPKLVDELNLDE